MAFELPSYRLDGKVAIITGAADTAVGDLPGSSCMGLHAEAAAAAIADRGELDSVREGVEREIEDAYEKAKNAPEPECSSVLEDVI